MDLLTYAICLLICVWPVHQDFACGSCNYQIALFIYCYFVSTLEDHADNLGISAWCDNKIVLEVALMVVANEVNTRIDALVTHFSVMGNICAPRFPVVA